MLQLTCCFIFGQPIANPNIPSRSKSVVSVLMRILSSTRNRLGIKTTIWSWWPIQWKRISELPFDGWSIRGVVVQKRNWHCQERIDRFCMFLQKSMVAEVSQVPFHECNTHAIATSRCSPGRWWTALDTRQVLSRCAAVLHLQLVGAQRKTSQKLKKEKWSMNFWHHYTKTRWSPRTRMPTRMLTNRDSTYLSHFQQTHLWDTLSSYTEVTLL